ncbi:MAG: archaemetzincin family Zn-dependent metalloprotease [Dehalococcoidia bacterium]|nr:archaemetzincin family Zn-dependent metalloprotease [Dehalococcoidia bacterium]
MKIDLQPVGEIEYQILVQLKDGLHGIFGCPVFIRDAAPIPQEAFNADQQQFLSDAFIENLKAYKQAGMYLLGITDANLYTQGLNFVFGQADINSGISIISLHYLRQENYGLAADSDLLSQRALKEAVHELGHNLGMGHCQDGYCVMHFSNSLIDTDVKKPYFCGRCQPKLTL